MSESYTDVLPLFVGAVAAVAVDSAGVPHGDQPAERAVLTSLSDRLIAACPHPEGRARVAAYRCADAWLALVAARHPRECVRVAVRRWRDARGVFVDVFGPFGGAGGVSAVPGEGTLDADVVSQGRPDMPTVEGGYVWHTDGRPPEPVQQ